MFCPNCGEYVDISFCPYCGCDLRKVTVNPQSRNISRRKRYVFASYMQYYPDKPKAIRRLRIDTGMGLAEAKQIVDSLFDDCEETCAPRDAKASARQENAQHIANTVARGIGMAALATGYLGFRVIGMLTKRYSGRRR